MRSVDTESSAVCTVMAERFERAHILVEPGFSVHNPAREACLRVRACPRSSAARADGARFELGSGFFETGDF